MWFYFFVFFIIIGFGSIYKYKFTNQSLWLYVSLWFFLFIVAGFRGEGVDNDHGNYLMSIRDKWGITEPSFYLIAYFCYDLLGSEKLVFITYAFLSVSLLFIGLKRLAPYFFLSLAVYFASNYVIHDLNAIRSGVAVGFTLLSFNYWIDNKKRQTFTYLLLATFFHFSFAMFFLIYFILKDNKKNLNLFISLIPIAYLMYFININALSLLMMIPISYVQTLAIAYSEWNTDIVKSVNVFSVFILIKVLIVLPLIIFSKPLGARFKGFYLYLKMYILGIFFLIFLAALPGAAFRVADLLWICECLLIPMLIVIINPHWVVTILVVLLCTFLVWINYVNSEFVRPYYFDFDL